MNFKPIYLLLAVFLLGVAIIIHATSNTSAPALQNTIVNTTVDMRAGSLDDFLLSENINPDEITRLVIVGDKYSDSIGKKIVIADKARIVEIWKTYFKDAAPFNRYYGEGSRRLDVYTKRMPNRPAMILLIDPTDFTSPVSRVDKGFRCPGLEKWIRNSLNNCRG